MSNKNRAQRKGYSAGSALATGASLTGPMGDFFGGIGMPGQSAGTRTTMIERLMVRKLMQISMSRFEWTGLPSTVNRRWLELTLMGQALAVFFKDPQNGQFFATSGSPAGNYNMVGDPTAFQAIAANGLRSWTLDVEHCVPIWANDLRWPDLDIINIYAHRIAQTDRTIEINLKNSRQPKILAYPQNLGLTIANFNRQVEEGSATIEVETEFGAALKDMIQVLDMAIHPDLVINTSIMRGRILYECMDMLGINHAPNSDKKERLVSAEVDSNNDIVQIIRKTMLDSRQLACTQINTMYPEIAELPENNPENEKDERKAEQLRKHPGVWVDFATALDDIGVDVDDQESNQRDAGPNSDGGESK